MRNHTESSWIVRRAGVCAALFGIAVCATASPVFAEADCVKLVFNKWCLGGDAATLPADAEPLPGDATGELRFTDRDKTVHVALDEGRIVHVWREETPGSWINYLDWRNKLIRIYGRGEEEKDFPPSATSRSSRLNAVVRGEGRAATTWDQTGWQVAVIWDTEQFVQLSYRLQDPAEASAGGSEGL